MLNFHYMHSVRMKEVICLPLHQAGKPCLTVFHKLASFSYRLFLGQSKSTVLSPSNRFCDWRKETLFVSLAPSSSFKYHMKKGMIFLPITFNFAFFSAMLTARIALHRWTVVAVQSQSMGKLLYSQFSFLTCNWFQRENTHINTYYLVCSTDV